MKAFKQFLREAKETSAEQAFFRNGDFYHLKEIPVRDSYALRPKAGESCCEKAAMLAKFWAVKTGKFYMVSSEMGTLCPDCAEFSGQDKIAQTIEVGHKDQCYNCQTESFHPSSLIVELSFADLAPRDKWTKIPVRDLQKAQREPDPNIDTELFDLLDKSYAYVGGHVDFAKASDIPANHTIWYAIDVDGCGSPDAVKFGKETPYGTKWTGGASDGTPAAKQAYVKATVDKLLTPGNYCEMSDAIAHIMMTRYHVPSVNDKSSVEKILGKSVSWIGGHPDGKYPEYTGFYYRSLGGSLHMKILLGKPR